MHLEENFTVQSRLLHLGVEVLDDGDIVTDLMDLNTPRSSSEFPPPLRLLHLDDEVLDDGDIVTDPLSKISARLGSKSFKVQWRSLVVELLITF